MRVGIALLVSVSTHLSYKPHLNGLISVIFTPIGWKLPLRCHSAAARLAPDIPIEYITRGDGQKYEDVVADGRHVYAVRYWEYFGTRA